MVEDTAGIPLVAACTGRGWDDMVDSDLEVRDSLGAGKVQLLAEVRDEQPCLGENTRRSRAMSSAAAVARHTVVRGCNSIVMTTSEQLTGPDPGG